MVLAAIIASIVAVVVLIGWFIATNRHPEKTSRHEHERVVTGSEERFGPVDERPGDPGSEAMRPDEPHPVQGDATPTVQGEAPPPR